MEYLTLVITKIHKPIFKACQAIVIPNILWEINNKNDFLINCMYTTKYGLCLPLSSTYFCLMTNVNDVFSPRQKSYVAFPSYFVLNFICKEFILFILFNRYSHGTLSMFKALP